ncbi:hypothetical protein XX58_000449 [Salmonella enterica subsp. salamae]|uniref:Uncharacterized protein n=9 Tax=Salmonella enterica TaxID=28901 RepID=A0A728XTK2_SALER|nr:hypothetical protein [Salmonella enterica]EDQ3822225.1 hypothetical protein [Salmonella enterica subsp. salamae]EDQ7103947.1 hypothetical protein [Salmonella enterica subsp. houtenae serovar 48:g,z51:-]EDR1780198.1 hypothetical protein [Salmonella enterica subsp. arizonae]EDT9095031.1 hypothetical protein [Salmonella enterica subsp. enterica]EDU0938076.1 hypothetical protein [Salmonella enterica subsp. arizonae serovar 48:z4,z24:-]EDW0468543.1 hypothetical protein [Salmonella enterica subs
MNVACDDPSGRGPWMGRVIRSQHISNLKYEGYRGCRRRQRHHPAIN